MGILLSNVTRESIITNHGRWHNVQQFAEFLAIYINTVNNEIGVYNQHNHINTLPIGGDRRSKLSEVKKEIIRTCSQ